MQIKTNQHPLLKSFNCDAMQVQNMFFYITCSQIVCLNVFDTFTLSALKMPGDLSKFAIHCSTNQNENLVSL